MLCGFPSTVRKCCLEQSAHTCGELLRERALQKDSKVTEIHLRNNHVHILVSIAPKYAVSQVVGYIEDKSAIHTARTYAGYRCNCWSKLLGGGYFVSTVGSNEEAERSYISKQEEAANSLSGVRCFETATFRWLTVLHRFDRFAIQASGSARIYDCKRM